MVHSRLNWSILTDGRFQELVCLREILSQVYTFFFFFFLWPHLSVSYRSQGWWHNENNKNKQKRKKLKPSKRGCWESSSDSPSPPAPPALTLFNHFLNFAIPAFCYHLHSSLTTALRDHLDTSLRSKNLPPILSPLTYTCSKPTII